MPEPSFRGDPYGVLGVAHDATSSTIKRRWRDLAREHHPDRAAGDPDERARLTARMARINAAYDVLRDPVRRARHDASPHAGRARDAEGRSDDGTRRRSGSGDRERDRERRAAGPPPPPPTRPVTARFDATGVFHRRNATTQSGGVRLQGHAPMGRNGSAGPDLRASTPTGPVERRPSGRAERLPSLSEARETELGFGRFHGFTLGQVADLEPTYIDWIARTITRDRDLVLRARVIAADLDERGIQRDVRPSRPGWGSPRDREEVGAV